MAEHYVGVKMLACVGITMKPKHPHNLTALDDGVSISLPFALL